MSARRKKKYKNIEIRGVYYRDADEAAAAHGVQPQAIRSAARRGTLHRVGLGAKGKEPMRVCIRGEVFQDARAAAKHHGVTVDAVWAAIWLGNPDRVGRKRNAAGKPVNLWGLEFPTMAEASRALGLSSGYVSLAMRRKSRAMMERIAGEAMRVIAEREGRITPADPEPKKTKLFVRPVEIGGINFPSMAEAGRQLGGLSSADIRDALEGRSLRRMAEIEAAARALSEAAE